MSEDNKQDMLAELRKIKSVVVCLFWIAVACIVGFKLIPDFQQRAQTGNCWGKVRAAVEHQNFSQALSMAKALVASQPNYDYGHTYLGYIYLAMDNLTDAEKQYSRAYELFPSKDNKENMEAVQKRLATESGSQHTLK